MVGCGAMQAGERNFMRALQILIMAVVTGTLLAAVASAGSPPAGLWRMSSGKATIRVSDCGGKLCGTIVALAKPTDKHGKPKRDKHNPNPSLRGRPVVGIAVMSGLKPSGGGEWSGFIYNPDDGNTYRSVVKLVSPSRLKVKGCVAMLCKSMDFNRVN